ncbi:MAG: Asp-tRNA(Asn)/Glu-tRNA(Gln) amidotransferase subunit GatA [Deltaproteobacteria bacterium]|nr:Asp-tRNA(Asn)/Glu-tRNA(Gln) amidotransferase subunit GatA [Deltaproteobacteria bacterium]
MEFGTQTIQELLAGYRAKNFKPTEVVERYLKNISERDEKLNSFLQVRPEETLKRARTLDAQIDNMSTLPLFGIPLAVKDNFLVNGWQATAGSKVLSGYISPYTATSVERLEAMGAVVVGKVNCDEFAMGSSNENSAFGPVRNPWDLERVPGGSSGGSSAAVAAGLATVSLGTDTGGSIRQPASLCGLVGLKPTYGRVSRYGIVSYASSLDQVGPFSRTVWDSARVMEVMSGFDPRDATSSKRSVPKFTEELNTNSKRTFKLGVSRAWLEGVDSDVAKSFDSALEVFKKMGCEIVEIDLPHTKYALSTYYLIAPSEASSNLARYDGVHYGYRTQSAKSSEELYSRSRGEGIGREVKLRIMLGTYALSAGYYDAFYLKANQVRRKIQEDFEKAFTQCDFVVSPTSPSTAFKLGEKTDDPLKMYLSDIFTLPVNLAGLPGLSMPCGLDSRNLPIGFQLIGKPFGEAELFLASHQYEQARGQFALPSMLKGKG